MNDAFEFHLSKTLLPIFDFFLPSPIPRSHSYFYNHLYVDLVVALLVLTHDEWG